METRREHGRTISRRAFLKGASVLGASLAGAGLGPAWVPPAWGQRPKVRLAYLQLGWTATEIIHQEDLLGKLGWDAEYTAVGGSPAGLVNTYAAGKVDSIDMSFALAAKMFEQGVPLRVVGVATAVLGAIVVPKGSPIKAVEELKGRKLASIVGTTTHNDIVALVKKGYGFDLVKENRIVTAGGPPDLVNLLNKGEVEGIVGWQPMTDQLVLTGRHVYLTKQIDLWRKATGRNDYAVHVCYLAHPEFLRQHPKFAADLNKAQEQAVQIWYNDRPRAIRHVMAITKLPQNVVEFAHGQTVRMMAGLTDEHIETLLVQLRLNKESGYLTSPIWESPDRVRREFFWRG
ncbi:MAG: ABC transporter substrate-binding protein [Deltaproteobacteria bacterium]|nr:ABC transporter substrate-binding protein [Deltaproteobacteria bacterium]